MRLKWHRPGRGANLSAQGVELDAQGVDFLAASMVALEEPGLLGLQGLDAGLQFYLVALALPELVLRAVELAGHLVEPTLQLDDALPCKLLVGRAPIKHLVCQGPDGPTSEEG